MRLRSPKVAFAFATVGSRLRDCRRAVRLSTVASAAGSGLAICVQLTCVAVTILRRYRKCQGA